MESNIQFITDLGQLLEKILVVLNCEINYQILISGTFDNVLFKQLIESILKSGRIKNCKIIVPFIGNSALISRSYINRISDHGGEIRINSKFKKNLIVIGKEAFILSLSSKYAKDYGIKSNFECSVCTNDIKTVSNICETFMETWDNSLPIVNC